MLAVSEKQGLAAATTSPQPSIANGDSIMTEAIEKTRLDTTDVRELQAYIDNLLTIARVSPAKIAVEAGVPLQRLKAWISGTGGDSAIPLLLAWKAEIELAGADSGGFVMTPTALRIILAFDRARESRGGVANVTGEATHERGMALIYGASGTGKSLAAQWYLKKNGGQRSMGEWPVVVVRCTGGENSREALYSAILSSMDGAIFYPQKHEKKIDTIRSRIPEGGIIIFDEAQLLSLRRLDELRYFPDECGIAIALMGNLTGYKELVDAKIGQIKSRTVRATRVVIDLPTEEDVDALLESWNFRGRKLREIAVMIGVQDGGLRLLAATASIARQFAKVKGKEVDADIFMAAAISAGAWGDQS